MALKVLILRNKLGDLQNQLTTLREAATGYEAREKELEADIAEAGTDEERSVVETAVTDFETERDKNTAEQQRLSGEIAGIEKQIRELEKAAEEARHNPPARGRKE